MQAGKVKVNNIPFSGTPTAAQSCIDKSLRAAAFEKGIKDTMPKSIQAIGKMSKFTGEMPNIIINALGTGLVAPIFIKYNFLSKTDDDTRTYSALRQPLSAVLSVATSLAVVVPFNRLVDSMSKNGFFFKLDDFKTPSSNFNKPTEKLEELVESATNDGKIEYTSGKKKITLNPEEVNNIMNKTIEDRLKDVDFNLERRVTEKIGKQTARGHFYSQNQGHVESLLTELDKNVGENSSEKEISKYFKSKIKELKDKKANQELIDIVDGIASHRDVATIKGKISEVRNACKEFSGLTSLEEVAQKVAKKIDVENNVLTAEKKTLEGMKKAIENGETFKDIIKRAKKIPDSTFVYDVMQKHMDNIAANLKGFKQVTGLVVSLAILPVACSMLNYFYPKFMDKFFPRLSDSKKSKTADTFQKAPAQGVQDASQPASVKKSQQGGK